MRNRCSLITDAPAGLQRTVCAVIVAYQTGGSICRCVDSVRNQVGGLIIIDNGSDTPTVRALKGLELGKRVTVIYNSRNIGIAAAQNQGVRRAKELGYSWVLTMDDDSEATPGMVEKLLDGCRWAGENLGVIAANPVDRNTQSSWFSYKASAGAGHLVDVKAPLSSGSLIPLRLFQTVGLFNESLFMYNVDCDFCMRLRKAGLRNYVRTDAVIIHREGRQHVRRFLGRRFVHDGYSHDARYYIARNTVFMIRKYYRDAGFCYSLLRKLLIQSSKAVLFDESRSAAILALLRGVRDGVSGKYGPGKVASRTVRASSDAGSGTKAD